jgi:D-beta-D-heptose 7-phosphate kinase/D-beta-D-heptose 1-phosphate adenosyltransferase
MHLIPIPDLASSRVLVIGDLMLDAYLHGSTSRISPEAPVPVVLVEREEFRVGGAGNVALNVTAMGAHSSLLAIVGSDSYADILQDMLTTNGTCAELIQNADKNTIVKKRVISKNHQLLRIDYESAFDGEDSEPLLTLLEQRLSDVDVVVLSDYAKGTLTHSRRMIEVARAAGKPVLVDPKGSDFWRYTGATVITPNLSEFESVAGHCIDDNDLATKATAMLDDFNFEAVLVTKSERGMTLVQRGHRPLHLQTQAREVFDVTGAGDTVIATLAAMLGAGCQLSDAVQLSNVAAGVVVSKFGTATVTNAELRKYIQRHRSSAPPPKVIEDFHGLLDITAAAKAEGEVLVLTNGCFDILHPGHVDYLRRARELGDRLIVLVNSDASVAGLKGPSRPINDIYFRQQMLAALDAVDYVCQFDTPTPATQIEAIRPDILVKGGDYSVSEIAGSNYVLANGGRVEILPFVNGYSSSNMIEKIRGS